MQSTGPKTGHTQNTLNVGGDVNGGNIQVGGNQIVITVQGGAQSGVGVTVENGPKDGVKLTFQNGTIIHVGNSNQSSSNGIVRR